MGIHSFADAGKLLFGLIGYWIFFAAQLCILIFIMAAHILTFSVMMNAITEHATCTVVFTVVGTVLSFLLSLPRTSKTQAHFSVACMLLSMSAYLYDANLPQHVCRLRSPLFSPWSSSVSKNQALELPTLLRLRT